MQKYVFAQLLYISLNITLKKTAIGRSLNYNIIIYNVIFRFPNAHNLAIKSFKKTKHRYLGFCLIEITSVIIHFENVSF